MYVTWIEQMLSGAFSIRVGSALSVNARASARVPSLVAAVNISDFVAWRCPSPASVSLAKTVTICFGNGIASRPVAW
jgi:hypothetical protein